MSRPRLVAIGALGLAVALMAYLALVAFQRPCGPSDMGPRLGAVFLIQGCQ